MKTMADFSEKEIKITMCYFRCTRQEAIEALEDGNDEAIYEYELEVFDSADRDFAEMAEW
ncbi:hypothetical protein [Rhizobium leguminosarum]